MQTNAYRALLELLPQDPLLVGTVTAVHADATRSVELPGGGTVRVRGTSALGAQVFLRGGVIETEAPALTPITIDV